MELPVLGPSNSLDINMLAQLVNDDRVSVEQIDEYLMAKEDGCEGNHCRGQEDDGPRFL